MAINQKKLQRIQQDRDIARFEAQAAADMVNEMRGYVGRARLMLDNGLSSVAKGQYRPGDPLDYLTDPPKSLRVAMAADIRAAREVVSMQERLRALQDRAATLQARFSDLQKLVSNLEAYAHG